MNVSACSAVSAADAAAPETVVVAKKALDQTKVDGQNAVALIQSAAQPPPLRPGQTISLRA